MKCFTYKCHPDNTLSINYGDKTIECTKSGELASLDGVMGYLVCPDLDRFCV